MSDETAERSMTEALGGAIGRGDRDHAILPIEAAVLTVRRSAGRIDAPNHIAVRVVAGRLAEAVAPLDEAAAAAVAQHVLAAARVDDADGMTLTVERVARRRAAFVTRLDKIAAAVVDELGALPERVVKRVLAMYPFQTMWLPGR